MDGGVPLVACYTTLTNIVVGTQKVVAVASGYNSVVVVEDADVVFKVVNIHVSIHTEVAQQIDSSHWMKSRSG